MPHVLLRVQTAGWLEETSGPGDETQCMVLKQPTDQLPRWWPLPLGAYASPGTSWFHQLGETNK